MGAGASTPANHPPTQSDSPSASCPVDHKTRAAWLSQHQTSSSPPPSSATPSASSPFPTAPTSACSSTSPPSKLPPFPLSTRPSRPLSQDREISTIPRALSASDPTTSSSSTTTTPTNSEKDTGHDRASGNWIYPSEHMFFAAMARKGHNPHAPDMSTIIPIHNAVNERAWHEILQWETHSPASDPGSKKCGGPKLYSFKGLGVGEEDSWSKDVMKLFRGESALSPKARMNGWMGYQRPFDRHDWVVERCGGERVEYVIDFYQGRGTSGTKEARWKLSFYLDVRPKLNSWEGWRMRGRRLVGL